MPRSSAGRCCSRRCWRSRSAASGKKRRRRPERTSSSRVRRQRSVRRVPRRGGRGLARLAARARDPLADANSVLGDFAQAEFACATAATSCTPAGPDGAPADFRVKYTLRARAAAAVPARAAGRAAAGLHARVGRAARSAGSTSTPTRSSCPATSCTGRVGSRTGTTCAPTVTRRTCGRATTRRPAASTRSGATSPSAARRVTAPARATSRGRARSERGRARAHGRRSASAAARSGRSTRTPATACAAAPREGDAEIETCAPCHSRRAQLAEGWRAGAPLPRRLPARAARVAAYWADGQQRAEDYPGARSCRAACTRTA